MSHITCHSHASQCLLYINSVHRLYNTTALDQLPLSSQLVPSTQQVSRSSSSSTYIGIASIITCGAFSYLCLSRLPFLCYDPKAKAWRVGCPPLYNKWDQSPFFLSSKGQKSTQDSNICFFSRSKQQAPAPSCPPRRPP